MSRVGRNDSTISRALIGQLGRTLLSHWLFLRQLSQPYLEMAEHEHMHNHGSTQCGILKHHGKIAAYY